MAMRLRPLSVLVAAGFLLTPAVRGQSPEQKQATIRYLAALQQADGGFLPSQPKTAEAKSSLRASSSALRALKYFGGDARDRAACGRLVRNCFDEASGGFVDHPGGRPDVATTAVGLMAFVELKLPVEPVKDKALRYLEEHVKSFEDIRIAAAGLEAVGERPKKAADWLAQVKAMQNPDGTFGKGDGTARMTGGAAAAVLRLGGMVDRDAVLGALNRGQRPDGGFGKEGTPGSDLETTYRVVRTYHMLQAKPADVERLRAFIAKCRSADGGYGVAPGQPSAVGSTYFAGIVLHWLGEK
jgi:prenyltransferase beta subunit